MRLVLRVTAVAIVIGGLIDPAVMGESPRRVPTTIAVLPPAGERSMMAARALAAALGDRFAPDIRALEEPASGRPCAAPGPCVLVTDGRVPTSLPDGAASLWAVRLPAPGPNAAITDVRVTSPVPPAAGAEALVMLQGDGLVGQRSRVQIVDDGVPVGTDELTWDGDGARGVSVPWFPLDEGTRRLRVRVETPGDGVPDDDARDLAVEVDATRLPVLVYEPRPSWAATFVRRALEGDPRWDVELVSRVAPGIAVRSEGTRLSAEQLADTRVVVLGAPDALADADALLLEAFVRQRGGTLVVLPDRTPSGAVGRLIGSGWQERLEASPLEAGPLRASELLVRSAAPDDVVLISVDDLPLVSARPLGRGRVVVSGAMDAWRYRDASGAFERFWQALVADGAAAAGPPVVVKVSPAAIAPGHAATIDVRMQTMAPREAVAAEAVMACGGAPTVPIRLWPTGEHGAFRGEASPSHEGPCRLVATVGSPDGREVMTGSAALLVSGDLAGGAPDVAILEQRVAAYGGEVVAAGQEAALAAAIGAATPVERQATPIHPFRSVWWLVPFVGALAGEWYLRRRAGLR